MRKDGQVVVTVPDFVVPAIGGGVKTLPAEKALQIKTKVAGVGTIRPAMIPVLLNRAMRRRLEKDLRRAGVDAKIVKAEDAPAVQQEEPVIPNQPLSGRETIDRMASLLIDDWDKYHRYFPAKTLAEFLDHRAGEILLDAWKKGKPVNREDVKRALANLWQQGAPEVAAKAR